MTKSYRSWHFDKGNKRVFVKVSKGEVDPNKWSAWFTAYNLNGDMTEQGGIGIFGSKIAAVKAAKRWTERNRD